MRVLLVEPWLAGSHGRWAAGFARSSSTARHAADDRDARDRLVQVREILLGRQTEGIAEDDQGSFARRLQIDVVTEGPAVARAFGGEVTEPDAAAG